MSRRWPHVEAVVFAAGVATLAAELAAQRLLAPSFGASTVVWANAIAVVLLALAGGYWAGGRLADRHPHTRGLAVVTLIGAALVALMPVVAIPLLEAAEDRLGVFGGSLVVVLLLAGPPVLVLGAVSPWAIRLRVTSVERAGDVTGRLYALSTAGGLVGTFASALLLIPLAGTRLTFLIAAAVLALAAVPGVRR